MKILENIEIKIYRILTVVLYGGETWDLTLKEVCRLRVFEDRVLKANIWMQEG